MHSGARFWSHWWGERGEQSTHANQQKSILIYLTLCAAFTLTHTHTHPPPLAVENPENGVKNVSNIQRVFPPRARASIGEVV